MTDKRKGDLASTKSPKTNEAPLAHPKSSTPTPPDVNSKSGRTITITLPEEVYQFLEGSRKFGPDPAISLEAALINAAKVGIGFIRHFAKERKGGLN